jgi:metal-dependent amidase/aminoacylase/carboxypeptidase family protein
MHACKVEFTYISGYRPVINDTSMEQTVVNLLASTFGKENITNADIQLGGEDFYEFSGYLVKYNYRKKTIDFHPHWRRKQREQRMFTSCTQFRF